MAVQLIYPPLQMQLLPSDCLHLLPSDYRKAVKRLNKKINNASNFGIKNQLFCNFAQKFTVLHEIRKYWFQ